MVINQSRAEHLAQGNEGKEWKPQQGMTKVESHWKHQEMVHVLHPAEPCSPKCPESSRAQWDQAQDQHLCWKELGGG